MIMATTLHDVHPDIIQTHILPCLDGPSLFTTATASSYLNNLCSDESLWSHVSRSMWPSITHPRVHDVISTFTNGHHSFFNDSFPALVTHINHNDLPRSWPTSKRSSCHLDRSFITWPSELISAVDIRYQNDIIYSRVKFTEITSDFMSSSFRIELNTDDCSGSEESDGLSGSINLVVDEIAGADLETLSHLKESITLNWILIHPTQKRACNLSSIKPISAKQDWVTNETLLRFVTILPGCDENEIVRCRIEVVLGVGEKGVGLYVKEVMMKLQDLDCVSLNGVEFLKVVEGAMMEENNVRRKVVQDKERWKSYIAFKEMKSEKKMWEEKKERKRELFIYFNYVAILPSFIYFLRLLLLK